MKRFRGGLVFKTHRLVYHSTLGLRIIKKKKIQGLTCRGEGLPLRLRARLGKKPIRLSGSVFTVKCIISRGTRLRVQGVLGYP